jgi:hypothetical protein
VPVTHKVVDGMIHRTIMVPKAIDLANRVLDALAAQHNTALKPDAIDADAVAAGPKLQR